MSQARQSPTIWGGDVRKLLGKADVVLSYIGFCRIISFLGLLPCLFKIKCTYKVINDLDFTNFNPRVTFVLRIHLGNEDFFDELP